MENSGTTTIVRKKRSSQASTKPRIFRPHKLYKNFGQLSEGLGVPLSRIRAWPPPGNAVVRDLIENNESETRHAVCELVDGTLVEKPMGVRQSEAAYRLCGMVYAWENGSGSGFGLTTDGIVRLTPQLARGPDFGYYLYEQFPNKRRPSGTVPLMFPNFAVEILSNSNTKKEMARKRKEYFTAGTKIVWEVDLKKQTVTVYHDPDNGQVFGIDDTLSGEDVLPGFTISIRKWLDGLTPE